MTFMRLVQAAVAALAIAAGAPASAQQVLKVGSTPTGVPFTFLDTKTNSIQGIMVDLITEIGKDAGFQVQIEPMQFSALVPSLTSNKIDIISAAMFATAARKEVIDFSDAVYTYGEGLVVPKTDAKNYASQEDLKGEAVGAQVGTAFVDALKKTGLFSEVKVYDTIPDILRDVNAGRLKAGFADYPILAYNLKQGNFAEVRLVDSYRNPQERHRVAGQDQRLARQAEGKRHHRKNSREMGTEGRRLLMSRSAAQPLAGRT
jgi:polar amino acid transport system substrate-binding protein